MRVTTSMLYDTGMRALMERQAEMLRTQTQLSTGRRVLAPADDPVASAQAVGVAQSRDIAAQNLANVEAARTSLVAFESAVADLQQAIVGARDLVLQAGNGSLSDADRRSLAVDLRGRFAEVLEIANRRDGNGRALFAGHREDVRPFADDGTTVAYAGDQGTRSLQVSAARLMPVGASGAALFESIAVGNGRFETAAAPANAGDAMIGTGDVSDSAQLTGHQYRIDFTAGAPAATYDVVDVTLGVTLSSGNPYASGASITVDGQRFAIRGAPATGDSFTLAPASRQSLFATLRDAIELLEAPATSAPARGRLATGLERGLASLDQAAERALALQTRFGASLRELEDLQAANEGIALEYDRQLSGLQDLDYAEAVSRFMRQQQALEAAQKAFREVTRLTLFSLL